MSRSRLDVVALTCVAGALALSAYLLARSFAVLSGGVVGGDVCRVVFGRGCDATLAASIAQVGGIPVAGWGAIGLASVLFLRLLGRTLGDPFRLAALAAATLLLALGALVGGGLIVTMARGTVPLCPLCLIANALVLAASAAHGAALARSGALGDVLRSAWRGLRWALGGRPPDPGAVRWCAVGFALVAVTGVALYQWTLIETDRRTAGDRPPDRASLVAAYEAAEVVEVRLHDDDASLGPSTASATLVVFSDAFCPHCLRLWGEVAAARRRHGDDLRIVHKHLPLDASCNGRMQATLHAGACDAAHALEAARRQGAFWSFFGRLGRVGPRGDTAALVALAGELGLDVARFQADVRADVVRARVALDVEQANRLGLDTTPAVFLNGRRLAGVGPAALAIVLEHVLDHGATPP